MTAPLALQLYTIREAMADDFAGPVRKVAEIGYVGVEPALFPAEVTPAEAGELFRELGLQVTSVHGPIPSDQDKGKMLNALRALGCTRMITSQGPEHYRTPELISETCDRLNRGCAFASENGLSFGYHNHWWEFQQVGDRYIYEVMLELLDPTIFFQIDTYWVKTAGFDPVEVVKSFGPRAPLLHIKDGPAVHDEPMVAAGDGVMDFPSIVQAAGDTVEWMIVEMDHCATDMMEAVEKSYRYLVGKGLAHGNKS